METLPQEVAVVINDFRFGTPSYWKKKYTYVILDLKDNITYATSLGNCIHFMDMRDDLEVINWFRECVLVGSLWQWKKKGQHTFPKLDF